MIKLVVTDLDGTLLNNQRELSETNKRAISSLIDLGVTVCFATGRPLNGMKKFVEECKLNDVNSYTITNTGSCIYDNKSFNLLACHYLGAEELQLISKYTKGFNVQVVGYSDFDLYSFSKEINHALVHDSKILSMPITTCNITDVKNPICRFNIMGDKSNIDLAIGDLPKEVFENYYTVRNEDFSFELLNKKSGKGNALRRLMQLLNLKKEEVLVLGDNFNDVEMLKEAGISVAVESGKSEVKSICSFITKSNEKHGFAYAVNKLIENDLLFI